TSPSHVRSAPTPCRAARPRPARPSPSGLIPRIVVGDSVPYIKSFPLPFPNRMLKKSASFVLASLRSSTYRSVRLASSLAAALLDGLFEHPAWCASVIHNIQTKYRPMKFQPANRTITVLSATPSQPFETP